ncbi:MAG: SDR family oxidoreductase [Chloroflexota bacterium]|nr:SDR family oxidoreductase [Chloroflexota bacterium]
MRALVAGGAGFLGSHLCERLLNDGHEVVCLDNFITGTPRNIAHLRASDRFSLVEADVAETPDIAADVVLHLASPASPADYERLPVVTMRANALGTWRLLDVCGRTGARLVFASTSEVYGDPLVHPQPEAYWGNVDPIGPRSCYDESKRFAEALIMAVRRERGVRANIVRIFNSYGPRMRSNDGRAIPELMTAALRGRPMGVHGDGSQTRSFCYVSDLVAGLAMLAIDETIDGEVFNLGNPAELSIRQLAEAIRRVTGSDSPIETIAARPGDPERRRPDITRIRERYGWSPKVELGDGLITTAEWFRAELAIAVDEGTAPRP